MAGEPGPTIPGGSAAGGGNAGVGDAIPGGMNAGCDGRSARCTRVSSIPPDPARPGGMNAGCDGRSAGISIGL